jgi:hypothetical protein
MANISAQEYKTTIKTGERAYDASKMEFDLLWGTDLQPPRVKADNGSAAAAAVGNHLAIEGIFDAGNTGTIALTANGYLMTTAAHDGSWIALAPLVPQPATVHTLFCNGETNGSTARNADNAALKTLFKTGTSAAVDGGKGIGFYVSFTTPATIATSEFYFGLVGEVLSDVVGAAAGTASYTVPTEGFSFYYDQETSANWQMVTNVGGTDTKTDTGVTLVASTTYELYAVLDAERRPVFYINGVYIGKGAALTAEKPLAPIALTKTNSGTAVSSVLHNWKLERNTSA